MTYVNNRSFSRSSNEMKSSGDHINRKRAEAIYTDVVSNASNKDTNVKFTESNNALKLKSVGGLGVKSYDLFLNLSRGRYYVAPDGRNVELEDPHIDKKWYEGDTVMAKINNCKPTKIETSINPNARINQRWDLFEGSFLVKRENSSDKEVCDNKILGKNSIEKNILINSDLAGTYSLLYNDDRTKKFYNSTSQSLARWNNNDPLRGFSFPRTFCMPK